MIVICHDNKYNISEMRMIIHLKNTILVKFNNIVLRNHAI